MICARPSPQIESPAAAPRKTRENRRRPSSGDSPPPAADSAARCAGSPSPRTASTKSDAVFQPGDVRLMKPGRPTAQSAKFNTDGEATIQAARAKCKTVPAEKPGSDIRRNLLTGAAPTANPSPIAASIAVVTGNDVPS